MELYAFLTSSVTRFSLFYNKFMDEVARLGLRLSSDALTCLPPRRPQRYFEAQPQTLELILHFISYSFFLFC